MTASPSPSPFAPVSPSRRQFLGAAGAAGLAAVAAPCRAANAGAGERPRSLRVIAYNVYECTGWPKDREFGKKATALGQMPARFAQELALYEPDVVNFSESPPEAVVRQIAERLGMRFVTFPSGGKWPGTLLSKYEIVDPRNAPVVGGERPADLFTRHWGRATVKVPGGEPLIVHSAHLHPAPEPDVRLREIPAMLASMRADLEAGRSMLLIGDLNHTPDVAEHTLWTDAGWVDTFAQVGEGPGLTIKADEPTRRIDYVMAAGPIAGQVVESRPLFEGAFRTNPADPRSFALSDHLPQLAVFDFAT
ncbi:endonuclease/exonuclease/phosphatase family protein [Alienimonas sp. DA493]|uniref:endonuclease/exonuclease/phosphatase family protein n=1 Tax=Alienimonas sp. DA493 TaxID=3373605 RepID=UPI0037544AD7